MRKKGKPDSISPRQIEAFKAIVETASVTAAAANMHVSQPSVSRLLHSLEEAVGFNLFERRKGRLVPAELSGAIGVDKARSAARSSACSS